MRIQPIVFVYRDLRDEDGVLIRAMVPARRYENVAKRQFADGGEYTLAPIEERSMASHNQYFAALHDYWMNLPEEIAARWPTETHFRRWLLVETSFFDEKEFDMLSEKHAKALGTFIRTEDEYARIFIRGTAVIVQRAKSQSLAAMGKEQFEASKRAVLDLAGRFVGVSPAQMAKHAGRHA